MKTFTYKISEWVMRVSVLNLLWIFFSILGLGIVGFFPATVAMYTIVRKWIKGETDVRIFHTFTQTFKHSLWKANVLGYISVIGGLILYLDYVVIQRMDMMLYVGLGLLLLTITFYYVMIVFFLFPVYVHYDIKLIECFKYAFIIGAAYPLRTIYMLFTMFVIYYITASFPVIFLFFSGSIGSLLIMRFTYVAFKRTEQKSRKLQTVE
ncbi:YesL family protein [Gracilibacillus sp. S3-1-1]|uniref:YesL family protein n=1 Tax=Gracilibacillus pellucidus TaxID=3095368 RepID=A0ACC6M8G6_9BACI|nr:YesL family protein [Gracilibacillus sp. S3-1-1]MDX8047225.1 YesL family protein [Gracilibacillus sp. S3-1-1]